MLLNPAFNLVIAKAVQNKNAQQRTLIDGRKVMQSSQLSSNARRSILFNRPFGSNTASSNFRLSSAPPAKRRAGKRTPERRSAFARRERRRGGPGEDLPLGYRLLLGTGPHRIGDAHGEVRVGGELRDDCMEPLEAGGEKPISNL
jgi:hypothetical protein